MPKLDAIAPIIWAKWGGIFLEALRQEAMDAPDSLAFQAMNSEAGIRTVLVVCTADSKQVQVAEETLSLRAETRSVEWQSYSVAEWIFRAEKRGGLSHQTLRDGRGRTFLALSATRPKAVQALERLFDLSD